MKIGKWTGLNMYFEVGKLKTDWECASGTLSTLLTMLYKKGGGKNWLDIIRLVNVYEAQGS